jgi:hypothetical protein
MPMALGPASWIAMVRGSGSFWNASSTKTFSVPSSWRATTVSGLLGQPQPINGFKIQIGQTPELSSDR